MSRRQPQITPSMDSEIQTLWQEVRELTLGTTSQIDRLHTPPTPLQFLRDYLSPNKPFILSSSAAPTQHWPATTLWPNPSYLPSALSSTVSLHLTPTGHADSLTPFHPNTTNPEAHAPDALSICFASAHVQPTLFPDALAAIRNSEPNCCVAYAQQQNDCFRTEYAALAGDCDGEIGWASEAIGCGPEAVNLWIGNELSETSFHKDHYENIYAVVTGEKHFLLLPPTDVHRMYIRNYPAAQYKYSQDSGEFTMEVEDPVRYVPWCSVNPYPAPEAREKEMSEFPLYFNGPKPFECTVKAGEILYLPSMWFHHVRQTPNSQGLTIAVNYWYDMRFDIKYAYFNFLQSVPHTAIHDTRAHKNSCLLTCYHASGFSLEDASNANGYLTDEGDDQEEK